MAQRKPRRFKLNRDTGVSIYVPGRPDPIRLEPGSHYTTDDKQEIDALQASADATEVKIPNKAS